MFDIKCEKCNINSVDCDVCEGVGYVITPAGKQLIDFLFRHIELDELLRLVDRIKSLENRLGD